MAPSFSDVFKLPDEEEEVVIFANKLTSNSIPDEDLDLLVEVDSFDKNDCKKGGWMDESRSDGTPFNNEGDCIQFINTGK